MPKKKQSEDQKVSQYDLFAPPDELDAALDIVPEPVDKLSRERAMARTTMRVFAHLSISNMSVAEVEKWLDKPAAVFGFKTPVTFYLENKAHALKWMERVKAIPRINHIRTVPKELLT